MGRGSSARRGGGRKVRSLSRKFVVLGFRGEGTWDVSGIWLGSPRPLAISKVCAEKVCVQLSAPVLGVCQKADSKWEKLVSAISCEIANPLISIVGFQRGVLQGGEISIIGVTRAPVAIIN